MANVKAKRNPVVMPGLFVAEFVFVGLPATVVLGGISLLGVAGNAAALFSFPAAAAMEFALALAGLMGTFGYWLAFGCIASGRESNRTKVMAACFIAVGSCTAFAGSISLLKLFGPKFLVFVLVAALVGVHTIFYLFKLTPNEGNA
jgi:hypothetical protein